MALERDLAALVERDRIAAQLAAFDDAVLTGDRRAFLSLWTPDGVWSIGESNLEHSKEISPLHARGHAALGEAFDEFKTMNEFFFRGTFRPLIRLEANEAIVRVPTIEYARRTDGLGYANVALYNDRLIQNAETWLFAERRYDYIWVDSHMQRVTGDAIALAADATLPLYTA